VRYTFVSCDRANYYVCSPCLPTFPCISISRYGTLVWYGCTMSMRMYTAQYCIPADNDQTKVKVLYKSNDFFFAFQLLICFSWPDLFYPTRLKNVMRRVIPYICQYLRKFWSRTFVIPFPHNQSGSVNFCNNL